MDRRIDWAALPMVVELYGVDDVEQFVVELCAVKDFVERQHAGNR